MQSKNSPKKKTKKTLKNPNVLKSFAVICGVKSNDGIDLSFG